MKTSLKAQKNQFINHYLPQTLLSGWTEKAWQQAAIAMDLPENYGYIFFPKGPLELRAHLESMLNEQLAEKLGQITLQRVRDYVSVALYERFMLLWPYQDSLRLAPISFAEKVEHSWQLASLIWQKAEDKSLDFNYYSKRMVLATSYLKLLAKFFALDDISLMPELIDLQIQKIMQFEKIKHNINSKIKKVPFLRLLMKN